MTEKEDIATIAKRAQNKLRIVIPPETPRTYPLLEKATVHKSPDVNVVVNGVAPKRKKEVVSEKPTINES